MASWIRLGLWHRGYDSERNIYGYATLVTQYHWKFVHFKSVQVENYEMRLTAAHYLQ